MKENPRTKLRAFEILRQEGPIELARRAYETISLKNRIVRHPWILPRYGYLVRLRARLRSEPYSDADPFKVIYVDPDSIEDRVQHVPTDWGRVVGGNWERSPFAERERFRTLRKRYLDGKAWEELPIDNELGRIKDRVYQRIADEGYKTQRELEEDRWFLSKRDVEICVGIDHDGSFVHFMRGKHRLSIAKILDLEEIPVMVRIRHRNWQRIRDEIKTADSPSELSDVTRCHLSHPDLQDILGEKEWSAEGYGS